MAVGILDSTILAVGNQFRPLVDTHPPTGFHSFLLGVIVTAAALCVLTLHIPTAFHKIRLYFRDAGAVAATPAFPIKRSHAQAQSAKAASELFCTSQPLPTHADEE